MYKEFFQLKETPFNVTADPGFFYASEQHRQAYSHLKYGIDQRKGIIALTGEVGTGKTTLCRQLLRSLDGSYQTALILNPSLSGAQLLRVIIKDFGIDDSSVDKCDLLAALNSFLLQQSNNGCNVILVIDEAQNLGVQELEQVRLLSNLETEKQKLLQIVLMGQPELDEKLSLNSLRQLNQRIAVRFRLLPLNQQDIAGYIHHRLRTAAVDSRVLPVFTDQAVKRIYELTEGTPRLINLLCDRALLAGFVNGRYSIDEDLVQMSAEEVLIA